MKQKFYKYQGTGNDFILIDNRSKTFDKNNTKYISSLCDRRFGIGADGLILLENHSSHNFKMVYYNADGNESSMCGNGGRCISAFAKHLEVTKEDRLTFEAIDGLHEALISPTDVKLKMQNVDKVEVNTDYVFLNTGSPHHVQLVDNVDAINVALEGEKIRYSTLYGDSGSNVNFVSQVDKNTFKVRTYERGVEAETLSCGTGVTAVAIAVHNIGLTKDNTIVLQTPGGELQVDFKFYDNTYQDVWLKGPVKLVFSGELA